MVAVELEACARRVAEWRLRLEPRQSMHQQLADGAAAARAVLPSPRPLMAPPLPPLPLPWPLPPLNGDDQGVGKGVPQPLPPPPPPFITGDWLVDGVLDWLPSGRREPVGPTKLLVPIWIRIGKAVGLTLVTAAAIASAPRSEMMAVLLLPLTTAVRRTLRSAHRLSPTTSSYPRLRTAPPALLAVLPIVVVEAIGAIAQ